MATREKKKVVMNVKREAAEDAFARYNDTVNRLEELQAKMNTEVTGIRERYDKPIGDLQQKRDDCFEVLQVYAQENPELFDKKKSVEWTHGVFGFRTGTPKLKTLKGFTWSSVLSVIKSLKPFYVRTVEEVNKELLLADREKLADSMKNLGVEVVQEETFYVQPDLKQVAV